jgi:hypothetical protein
MATELKHAGLPGVDRIPNSKTVGSMLIGLGSAGFGGRECQLRVHESALP